MASLDPVAPPHVLTIAGSDSGGGAGIQADLKTAAAFGCYGSSVITALTAQNTLGVQGVHVVPPEFVVEQLKSLFDDDLHPTAAKFGMLASPATISALASYLSALTSRPYLVLDPVMISTSGHELLAESARTALLSDLLPLVDLVTPNIPEAAVLLGTSPSITTLQDVIDLAHALHPTLGGASLLLKGGHLPVPRATVSEFIKSSQLEVVWIASEDPIAVITDYKSTLGLEEPKNVVVDVLFTGDKATLFVGECVDTSSTHGTGCTLSAALASAYALEAAERRQEAEQAKKDVDEAAELALAAAQADAEAGAPHKVNGFKRPVEGRRSEISHAAVRRAIAYTQAAIASAPPIGRGNGPLNHGHASAKRQFPPPTKHNPTPFTSHLVASSPLWDEYVRHPFVIQLGNGTLPLEAFKHYIAQDYHYLRHYARAHAVGSWKASDFETIKAFAEITLHVAKESEMHVQFCAEFGITPASLHSLPESAACSAYARYVLDVATQGDVLDVLVAVLSCLIGYGEVGLWLRDRVASGDAVLEGNPYARWMRDYAGDEFIGAVRRGIATLEKRVAEEQPGPEKIARLTHIFAECVRLERDFWQMGLDQSW